MVCFGVCDDRRLLGAGLIRAPRHPVVFHAQCGGVRMKVKVGAINHFEGDGFKAGSVLRALQSSLIEVHDDVVHMLCG